MRYPIRRMIFSTFCVAITVAPGCGTSPFDGTWSGQVTNGGSCAGTVATLTVADGAVISGTLKGPIAHGTYAWTKIDPDGKVRLTAPYGHSVDVTFTDDHF